jgi:capsular exopolysaccharide synthesis family protein
MVSSPFPKEGKTTIAAHFAIVNAQQKRRTLLIDADLRRPAVGNLVRLRPGAGIAHALLNGRHWRDQITRETGIPDLDVLGAGTPSFIAANLIGQHLHELLEDVREEYSLIVVDAPPMLGFHEPLQMATAVDGVLLVAQAGGTNMETLGSAMAVLKRVHANVIGMVLNKVDRRRWYYGVYY